MDDELFTTLQQSESYMILLSFKDISGHFPGPRQAGVGNMTTIPEELCSKNPVVCLRVHTCAHEIIPSIRQ